jgi:spore germination cell wall hydrolase CwlJ-like protein
MPPEGKEMSKADIVNKSALRVKVTVGYFIMTALIAACTLYTGGAEATAPATPTPSDSSTVYEAPASTDQELVPALRFNPADAAILSVSSPSPDVTPAPEATTASSTVTDDEQQPQDEQQQAESQEAAEALALQNAMNEYGVDDKVLKTFAKLVASEALNQPYEGKVAVAAVVLNRDKSGIFGMNSAYDNHILGLIFASGQFDGVHTKAFKAEPTQECIDAVKDALLGNDPSGGAVFFCNQKICHNNWDKIYDFTVRIGDHWFYKK